MFNWLQRVLAADGANDPEALRAQADAALERGDFAAAETLYGKARKTGGGDAALHLGLGFALNGQGRTDEARQAAHDALALDAALAPAHFLFGLIDRNDAPSAETHYRRSLELDPGHAGAALRLGLLLHGQGRAAQAAQAVEQCLAHGRENKPGHSDLHTLRANLYFEEGRFDEAAMHYEAVLAQQPAHAAALANFGLLKLRQHDLPRALELLQRAADLDPYSAATLHNLGLALRAAGRRDEALACHEQALAIAPELHAARRDLAALLSERGMLPEAIAHLRQALAARPDDLDARHQLGEALLAAGNFAEAADCCRAVVQAEPRHVAALVNLAGALQGMRHFADAGDAYRRALLLSPEQAVIHFNLGTLLQSEGYFSRGDVRREKFAAARAAYRAALELEPGYLDALLCQGALAMAELKLDDALAWFDRALALHPENADARTRRGQLALLMGDFASGWRDCEYRFGQTGNKRLPPFSQPLWRNDFPLAGKTILLIAEQGMGDALHFVRYVALVAEQSPGAILIEAHEALHPLLRTLPAPVTVLEPGRPYPAFDCYCPLMSLPFAFGTRLDTIPARIPYLAPDPRRAAQWEERLHGEGGGEPRPRIGIVWSGSAELNNDFNRSIALKDFAALLPPGRRVFSLQKDVREADAKTLAELPQIVQVGALLHDYADTAAAIAGLDLIVSVDTSVAHLAGALGKPVWILLPFLPDYRWLTERSDSPWYPAARLFRQTEAGDWSTVFAQVRQALDSEGSSTEAAS